MIKKKNTYNEKNIKNAKQVNETVNENIPFQLLQVISAQGDNLGDMSLQAALVLAQEEQLDLVLVSAGKHGEHDIPVAKIMNYSKKVYEDKKKSKLTKKKSNDTKLKEIRLSIKISDHDLKHKIDQAVSFLIDGCRVKVALFLKGRERSLRDTLGVALMNKVTDLLQVARNKNQKELAFDEENESVSGLYRIFYLKK